MNDFIKNASGLTKNPLGIIALFISLIYGFACLVLSTSLSNMINDKERLPLIWFIIIFPILILVAFIFLVVFHHEKLYSPGDFRDDNSFMKALNKKRIKNKIRNEAKILEDAETINESSNDYQNQVVPNSEDSENVNDKKNDISTPELQTSGESVTNVNVSGDLISKLEKAELWVAREIGLKYNLSIQTNLSFSTKYGIMELDFVGHNANSVYVAEIKYWEINKSTKPLKISLQDFLRKHSKIQAMFTTNKDFKLMIAIVFDKIESLTISDLETFIRKINNQVILEVYDYSKLKKDYEN